ncbi:MAG TPA: DUF4268 domain-containing protein [Puia sp.]|nr:DUF4268 domain-containing protein [Puia sp.]
MYTKQEISKQKQAFWTAFGRYMKPVLSADSEAISWLNYKTGIKQVSFKMEVDSKEAEISIVLHDPAYYERFVQLKGMLYAELGEDDWAWVPPSLIQKKLTGVNIFRNEDWPAIISFLKPRIIALDSFWSLVKDAITDMGG